MSALGRGLRCAALGLLAAACSAGAAFAQETGDVSIKRSDVVFMGPSLPEVYKQYGTTVVSWGGRGWGGTEGALQWHVKQVQEARDMGIRYLPGAAFRTAFAEMIDFDPNFMDSVCRSLDGEPILVPWLWDQKHKGHPAYWFCTNSPGYRAYLKHQMEKAFAAGAEGLHIDDYAGTSGAHWAGGGCFCRYCVAAFREYLKANVASEKLRQLGIASLDDFDYGEFLRRRGVTAAQFKKEASWYPEKIPLSGDFLAFQARAAVEWVAEYRRWAEGVAGHPLALCVNSAVSGPDDLMIAPVVTFFSGEVEHEAGSGKLSAVPIWTYKLGDALGRPVACTAAGWDWAFVKEHDKPGLVRAWIAQAYAFGHQFMPPVHQWCYTQEKGTHWYDPRPEEFAYLCRFVREHADLFDGYDPVEHVGLLYSSAAFRRWHMQAKQACADLAMKNVPFRLVLAGDDWLPSRLKPEDLGGLKAVVVTEPTDLDPAQQAVLEGARARLVAWPNEQRLSELAPTEIVVEGASNVTAVPRARKGDAQAPFVCHLVNRNYVPDSDSLQAQRNFTVRLSRSLFGADIARATLYAPGKESVQVAVERLPEGCAISVPELDLWAVLRLERF